MIVDVWFQPWLAGGTRARAVDEFTVEAPAATLGDALGNFGSYGCMPIDVGAAAATRHGPGGLRHGGGMEWVTKTSRASSARSPSDSSARSEASTDA